MRPMIVGTAGHVDHGKTTLIRALTGIDTDRLREEKERQLTIDLGFAPFDLPSGRRVGVIDVPGHEKFMGNMLAGIGGIDLVLLIIDANEGVMPQTREHLEVINLLKIKKALIVLTKIDTVDPDWLDLVEEEIREELEGTLFADADMMRVSALKGIGIPELKDTIDQILDTLKAKDSSGPLRLPVDRSFKMKGFGTVITGTLLSGKVEKDQQLEMLPGGNMTRVRNIEVHNEQVDTAYAGQRVALNLAGVEKEDIPRGTLIAQPGFFQPTDRLDVEIEMLSDFPHTLKHASRVHFHLGTSETLAKVYLLETKELLPGQTGLAQLELDEKVVAHYQDKFIIRFYSPVRTMGGGHVLNTSPKFYRRYREQDMAELKLLAGGEDKDLVLQRVLQYGIISWAELVKEAKMAEGQLQELITELKVEEMVFELGDEYLVAAVKERDWHERILKQLDEFHTKYHLKAGLSRAELKQALPDHLSIQKYDLFLNRLLEAGEIRLEQHLVALASFTPQPTDVEDKQIKKIRQLFADQGIETPDLETLAQELKVDQVRVADYIEYLIYLDEVLAVADGYFVLKTVIDEMREQLIDFLNKNNQITLGEARDLFNSSRKYTLPLLEYFDEMSVTRRKENVRVLA